MTSERNPIDALAQEIRRVDGNHSLGAGALAEALMPFLASTPPAQGEAVAWRTKGPRGGWMHSDVLPSSWRNAEPLCKCTAPPPVTGEGVREALEPLIRAVAMTDEYNEARPAARKIVKDFILDSDLRAILAALIPPAVPVPVAISCPKCDVPHIDEGEWATTRHHKTHQCQSCGHEWRPFPFATVGVAPPAGGEG